MNKRDDHRVVSILAMPNSNQVAISFHSFRHDRDPADPTHVRTYYRDHNAPSVALFLLTASRERLWNPTATASLASTVVGWSLSYQTGKRGSYSDNAGRPTA